MQVLTMMRALAPSHQWLSVRKQMCRLFEGGTQQYSMLRIVAVNAD
jgi:hypothetical protein